MSSLRRPHVLVAQPRDNDLELILVALGSDPQLHLTHGRTGEEVIAVLKDSGRQSTLPMPSLLLLDLELRGPTALDLIRKLRSCPRTNCLPIVALEGDSEKDRLEEAYDAGANSCLAIPDDRSEFDKTVQRVTQYWVKLNQLPNVLGAATNGN